MAVTDNISDVPDFAPWAEGGINITNGLNNVIVTNRSGLNQSFNVSNAADVQELKRLGINVVTQNDGSITFKTDVGHSYNILEPHKQTNAGRYEPVTAELQKEIIINSAEMNGHKGFTYVDNVGTKRFVRMDDISDGTSEVLPNGAQIVKTTNPKTGKIEFYAQKGNFVIDGQQIKVGLGEASTVNGVATTNIPTFSPGTTTNASVSVAPNTGWKKGGFTNYQSPYVDESLSSSSSTLSSNSSINSGISTGNVGGGTTNGDVPDFAPWAEGGINIANGPNNVIVTNRSGLNQSFDLSNTDDVKKLKQLGINVVTQNDGTITFKTDVGHSYTILEPHKQTNAGRYEPVTAELQKEIVINSAEQNGHTGFTYVDENGNKKFVQMDDISDGTYEVLPNGAQIEKTTDSKTGKVAYFVRKGNVTVDGQNVQVGLNASSTVNGVATTNIPVFGTGVTKNGSVNVAPNTGWKNGGFTDNGKTVTYSENLSDNINQLTGYDNKVSNVTNTPAAYSSRNGISASGVTNTADEDEIETTIPEGSNSASSTKPTKSDGDEIETTIPEGSNSAQGDQKIENRTDDGRPEVSVGTEGTTGTKNSLIEDVKKMGQQMAISKDNDDKKNGFFNNLNIAKNNGNSTTTTTTNNGNDDKKNGLFNNISIAKNNGNSAATSATNNENGFLGNTVAGAKPQSSSTTANNNKLFNDVIDMAKSKSASTTPGTSSKLFSDAIDMAKSQSVSTTNNSKGIINTIAGGIKSNPSNSCVAFWNR